MYGKVFTSIYDGTLVEDWRALITFQQFITLSDADGIVDMTPFTISRRTGIPIEHIEAGIKVLQSPDKNSRTPGEEGRRIMLIDGHRDWGWLIVNHNKYKNLQDSSTVREQTRERVRKHREKRRLVTDGNKCNVTVTEGNAKKRHIDINTDTHTLKPMSGKPDELELLNFLNEKTGRNYQPVKSNVSKISARLKEYSLIQLRQVIVKKCREWATDEKMNQYLRPATLFNAEKCAQYVGELVIQEKDYE